MERFTPEQRSMDNYSCWKKTNRNGTIEYYNKDCYDADFNLIKDKLLNEIQKELNR